VSPLRNLLPDYVAPERLYLEARWASLVPYAAAAGLLADTLPIASGANATTLREHVLRVAERAEAELAEERPCFSDGCPAELAKLPILEGRIAVDGTLRPLFEKWYPGLANDNSASPAQAADA